MIARDCLLETRPLPTGVMCRIWSLLVKR